MSITKNTRRRKKAAPQTATPVSLAKSQASPVLASQKAADHWSVINKEVSQLLRRLSAAQRLAYAALFHAAMQKLRIAWRRPSSKQRQAVAEFLNDLQQESRNRRYRRILRAMAAAAEESEAEMMHAYRAARLAVETVFEWSEDYRFIFGDYEPPRKSSR
jgi:hypothetical protein